MTSETDAARKHLLVAESQQLWNFLHLKLINPETPAEERPRLLARSVRAYARFVRRYMVWLAEFRRA